MAFDPPSIDHFNEKRTPLKGYAVSANGHKDTYSSAESNLFLFEIENEVQ